MRIQRILLALCLLLTLALSGCASVLNRSYSAESPHIQYSDADMDSGYLRAENYQQLVSAILFLVSQSDAEGVIRLYDYGGSAESDLDAAYWEVLEADPLGAYAVDYIKYELRNAVSYYEVELSAIAYRRSAEQIASVVSVTGVRAVSDELLQRLPAFPEEVVCRVSYFEPELDEADIVALVLEAYYALPASAVGRPEIAVRLYPQESAGHQRMVEILLDYPYPREELLARSRAISLQARELTASIPPKDDDAARFSQMQQSFSAAARWAREGASDAYAALLEGEAGSEGLALAAGLLCQTIDIPCQVINGTRQGQPHSWLTFSLEDGAFLHWDPAQGIAEGRSDEAMASAGYQWTGAA